MNDPPKSSTSDPVSRDPKAIGLGVDANSARPSRAATPLKRVPSASARGFISTTPMSPLTHTSSRLSTRSAQTFLEAPGVVAAIPQLQRSDTRIRRVSEHAEEGYEVEAGEEDKKEIAVELVEGTEVEYPDGGKEVRTFDSRADRQAWLVVSGTPCGFGADFRRCLRIVLRFRFDRCSGRIPDLLYVKSSAGISIVNSEMG